MQPVQVKPEAWNHIYLQTQPTITVDKYPAIIAQWNSLAKDAGQRLHGLHKSFPDGAQPQKSPIV